MRRRRPIRKTRKYKPKSYKKSYRSKGRSVRPIKIGYRW